MKETIERLGKTFEDLGYRQQWQALSNQAIIIATKTLQIRAILKKSIQTEKFTMKGFEIIQNQENEIQQAKDAIIPTLNQISPITEINGLNEASIIEINQVAQDLLLEQSKTIKHLQNVINTQQIQITNLQNETKIQIVNNKFNSGNIP